ncbi:MAG TPA: hypothetical protein VN451_11265, partial [Chitinophagaceae bacterium]|nr:hypothetical protein [Chitinophagaceae bacterium]
MAIQQIIFRDIGLTDYKAGWDYQEKLLQENVRRKSLVFSPSADIGLSTVMQESGVSADQLTTKHYLLFTEHLPVYTLGKSGNKENVLLSTEELKNKGIDFFHT